MARKKQTRIRMSKQELSVFSYAWNDPDKIGKGLFNLLKRVITQEEKWFQGEGQILLDKQNAECDKLRARLSELQEERTQKFISGTKLDKIEEEIDETNDQLHYLSSYYDSPYWKRHQEYRAALMLMLHVTSQHIMSVDTKVNLKDTPFTMPN